MYELVELTLKEIQKEAFKILIKIDEICKQENLTYYLAYGSLIGAIRHNGIIPWDDDIDIMMPRQDYEKLQEYFVYHQSELYPLQMIGPDLNDEYPYMINRVNNCDFVIDKQNEKDYGLGIFVDIYPLDAMGNTLKEAEQRKGKSCRYASLCFLSTRLRYAKDNTKSKLKMILKFPAFYYAKWRGKNYFFRKLKELASMQNYEDAKYVGCIVWASDDGYKGVFEKKWMGNGKLHEFEGADMRIPDEYDPILKKLYGDYMTLPSEEGRKSNHEFKAYRRSPK